MMLGAGAIATGSALGIFATLASGTSPLGRVSTPSDIVGVIRFLLTTASNYVNGAMIPVDGGTSAAFVAGGFPAAPAPRPGRT